jgi:nicotinamidase-related amidase
MLTSDNAVLVIVDVQGKLAQHMADRETVTANIQRMIKGAQVLSLPILWVEQMPDKLGPTIAEIAGLMGDLKPIPKTSFSCAGNPVFMESLKQLGRKKILVVGIEAHVCVYQTAVELVAKGYSVDVVEDAIASRSGSNKSVGVRRMSARGVGITSTEMALFELMRDAAHPAFREVQGIIK